MSYISKEWNRYEVKSHEEVLQFLNDNKDRFIFPPTIVWYDGVFLIFVYESILYY